MLFVALAICVSSAILTLFIRTGRDVQIWIGLKGGDSRLLTEAVRARGAGALPVLANALRSKNRIERQMAVLALGEITSSRSEVVDLLIRALNDPSIYVRSEALSTLGRLGPEASAAVPKLAGLLEDPSPTMRLGAIQAIGQIGSPARQTSPALQRLAESEPDGDARELAAWALGEVLKPGHR